MQGLVGDIVRTLAPHTEADPAALLLQSLTAVGNIIGRNPHFYVGQTRHALNLFTVLVGKTARARKGTSWDLIASPLRRIDPQWAERCVGGGLSTGEGVIAIAAGGTIDPAGKCLLFLEEEFSSLLRVMTRRDSTLSETLRKGWDNRTLRVSTRHEPLIVRNAHISLIGHVTLHNLTQYTNAAEIHGGLFNRNLWAATKRSKFLPHGGNLPSEELNRVTHSLRTAIQFAKQQGNVEFSRKARALWEREYFRLTDPPQQDDTTDAVTARAEAQVRRIDLVRLNGQVAYRQTAAPTGCTRSLAFL
jgi:hypothetical protein